SNSNNQRRLSLRACDILNNLRCQNKLCDCTIVCDDLAEFPIHRIVLSATSSYFYALFTNGMNETQKWAYTRDVEINSDNVLTLLPAADRFQVFGLVTKCTEFLQRCIECENVIGIRKFASVYYCQSLKSAADSFLMRNFLQVAKLSMEIFELSFEEFNEIILSDELNVRNENDLFDIIIKWIEFASGREEHLKHLLKSVRFGFIDKKFFIEKIRSNLLVQQSNEVIEFLNDCSRYLIEYSNQRMANLSDIRMRPRIPHELLVVVGGWSSGSPTNSIETFDPQASIWQNFDYLDKAPRAYHGCLVIGDCIYIIGGFDGTQYFNNCRKFNIKKREWQEMAPMNTKRCYVSVAAHEGIIYAMGGFDGYGRHKTAEKYNLEKNQWSFISEMNEFRSDASAAELNGKIFICGGFNGSDCVDTVEFYDPETNRWTLVSKMGSKRSGVGLISYMGCLYAIGGYDGFLRLNTCERYDLKSRKWFKEAEMNSPRSNFGLAVFDNCIFVMGGFNGITTIANVECYCVEEKRWKIKEKMNLNRSALSVCVFKDIDHIRPFSALVIRTKFEDKINRQFLNNVYNLSQNYINYLRSFN
ncbi:kelch 10, partial [Brachionus plicatilis]